MNPRGSCPLGSVVLHTLLVTILFLAVTSAHAAGPNGSRVLPTAPVPSRDGVPGDFPLRSTEAGARLDTTWFGSYTTIGGDYYALSGSTKESVMWTFDRGNGPLPPPTADAIRVIPNGEGWKAIDKTAHTDEFFRRITAVLDLGELPGGGAVPSPLINGAGSLWVGYTQPEADAVCWECRAGYGNDTCTRLNSPVLGYDGTGNVTLTFAYWSASEACFDGTAVWLRRSDNTELLLNPYDPPGTCSDMIAWSDGFTGHLGTFDADGVVTGFVAYNRVITEAEIEGSPTLQIVFEFTSDGGWSDEDCEYPTVQGPFGADDIALANNLIGGNVSYDFETDLQGWTSVSCNAVGDFVDIVDVSSYTILDPCACRLESNVLEMHAGEGEDGSHPDGQHVAILGPICELPANPLLKIIGIDFDMYGDLPQNNGVLIRPGAEYYPYTCPSTGAVGWSGRVGQDPYNYNFEPTCATSRYIYTDLANYGGGDPVPPDAQKLRPILELLASCESFTIAPCSGITNFTPIFDNIAVWATAGINAPPIAFDFLTQYIDNGSFPSDLFDVRAAVPANIAYDKHGDTPGARDLLGDSLVITGPVPSGADPNTRWEARMWWRVAKRGPFQADKENGVDTRYKIWKSRVSDGLAIDRPYRPQFTFGWMDSVQIGGTPTRNKFKSDFRESDDDFAGENNPETEMIWDDALRPGSQIEYFITSNYIHTPTTLSYLPDTTGGFFFEFEALPGIRVVNVANCGGAGFNYCVFQPATLYVDAYGAGAQFYIENALRTVLNGLDPCLEEDGCPIPQDRNWDRYDYSGAAACCNAPMARGAVAGSNNGLTMNQILGYRTMIVNTGTLGSGGMDDRDFPFFESWLTSLVCPGALNRQVFIMNGDRVGQLMESPGGDGVYGPAFMANVLGATLFCDSFNGFTDDTDCGEENTSYCVRLLPVAGGPFGTLTEVDAWGNACPNGFGMNVFSPNGTGVGNRTYSAEDPPKVMSFAQIVNENLGASNYRTVLAGVSYHHTTRRNAGGQGESLCPRDVPSIVDGIISEMRATLRWGFGVADDAGIPKLTAAEELGTCQGTWMMMPADVGDQAALRVNRLYPNEPNPFNPRTTIRFSLAQPGDVKILVYDVTGRLVRTLVDGKRDVGRHSVVWDGTNDEGHKVGSGVYWSQMKAGFYVSSKKMVVLK